MRRLLMAIVVGSLVVASGCGDGGDQEPAETLRCGGLHWVDAEGRDGYTGCEGNAGDWSCECGVEAAQAFQGDTAQSNDSADTCAQAVAQTCPTTLPLVTPCAGLSSQVGTCWYTADEMGDVSGSTYDCRCESGVAPQQVDAASCQAALESSCE